MMPKKGGTELELEGKVKSSFISDCFYKLTYINVVFNNMDKLKVLELGCCRLLSSVNKGRLKKAKP